MNSEVTFESLRTKTGFYFLFIFALGLKDLMLFPLQPVTKGLLTWELESPGTLHPPQGSIRMDHFVVPSRVLCRPWDLPICVSTG